MFIEFNISNHLIFDIIKLSKNGLKLVYFFIFLTDLKYKEIKYYYIL
jgi:hypothetical protein